MDLPRKGGVLVADDLHTGDGRHLRCPAAPLLAGEFRRRGIPVRRGTLHRDEAGLASHHALLSPTPHETVGLGVAALAEDARISQLARRVMLAAAAVAGPRTVLLAEPRSFCAGVERAIDIVDRSLDSRAGPVYVRKEIVHNRHVVEDLARRGAVFVEELDEVPDGATVVFSAHGVSPAVREDAARRGLEVVDGTCPLVAKVHVEARRFAARGDTVVLIGHAGHEEVEGTMGEIPEAVVLVESRADVAELSVEDPERVSYLTQTTLAVDETADIVNALRQRFPALSEPPTDDICYATTNRQHALRAVVAESDLVLVVGSANSSNSVRLVELAHRHGTAAHLVDDAGDVRPDWLAGATTVGLTAGASAPRALVDGVVSALRGLGHVHVEERVITRETVTFGLPSVLRGPRRTDG